MKNIRILCSISYILVFLHGLVLKADERSNRLSTGTISDLVEVAPAPYDKALRNPLKGFTTRGIYNHEWATLAHTYIKWNAIENHESDGIDKIRRVTWWAARKRSSGRRTPMG